MICGTPRERKKKIRIKKNGEALLTESKICEIPS